MNNTKLNGSITELAQAFQNVITHAVEPIHTDLVALHDRIDEFEESVDKKINTTNENMQAQFAKQEEKITEIIREGK